MDEHIFDSIVRALGDGASRRRLINLLGGGLTGGALLALERENAKAGKGGKGGGKKKGKPRKNPCAPCRIRRKGKCKAFAPDNTACGVGMVCHGGACIASCLEGQPCGDGGTCRNGQCVLPATCTPTCVAPQSCVNGACACPNADETCGAICCDGTLACEDDVCTCEDAICSCPAGGQVCAVEVFGTTFEQCCLAGDTCDPVVACTTDMCSAGNTFCAPGWAYCNDSGHCSCAQTVTGAMTCVNEPNPSNECPETSECDDDADCGAGAICVNPCCPEGEVRGVCMELCDVERSAPGRERQSAKARKLGRT